MAASKIIINDTMQGDFFYKEALKTLRANIQFSGRKRKTILFTSVLEGEGKSDTVFHLSREMANMGKKVLFIDADIRNTVFTRRYGVEGKYPGLSEYLSGQVENAADVLHATNIPNLWIILAGAYAANPAEMLGDEHFEELIMAADKAFDYVFIDTPPLLQIIDAAMIAQYCDGAVIVMESGAVSYRAAQKVKVQLEATGCHILGVVLNKVSRRGGAYGYKYGKYGKYGYGEKAKQKK